MEKHRRTEIRETATQKGMQTRRQVITHTDTGMTDRHTDRQTERPSSRQTGTRKERPADRQAGRQTETCWQGK